TFGRIRRKPGRTPLDGTRRDIHTDIFRIAGKPKLRAVAAAKLDHPTNVFRSNEAVQGLGLELGQAPIGAGTRCAAVAVNTLPEGARSWKCQAPGARYDGQLRQFSRRGTENGYSFDEALEAGACSHFPGHY